MRRERDGRQHQKALRAIKEEPPTADAVMDQSPDSGASNLGNDRWPTLANRFDGQGHQDKAMARLDWS